MTAARGFGGASRKVRTPKGRTLARARRRKPTESGTERRPPPARLSETPAVRVKRWGKSPPASRRRGGLPNPVRCKANRARRGCPPRARVAAQEGWSSSTESGLQACYGKPCSGGAFYPSWPRMPFTHLACGRFRSRSALSPMTRCGDHGETSGAGITSEGHCEEAIPQEETRKPGGEPGVSGFGKGVLGFLVARPLIAIAIAVVVVGVSWCSRLTASDARHAPRAARGADRRSSRCSSASEQYAKTLRQDRAQIVSSGAAVRAGAAGRQADRGRSRPRQAGLRLEGDVAPQERGQRLLPAGRQDRRLHGNPAVDSERCGARDGARPRGRACDGRARGRANRAGAPDQESPPTIIAGGVAFTPSSVSSTSWRCSASPARRLASVQPFTGVRGGPHRTGLHGGAGYDPRQAVAFWKRMLRASKGKEPPEFASDHPSDEHRIERIEGWLPEAEHAQVSAPSG